MHIKWLDILRSPIDGTRLQLKIQKAHGDIINEGELIDSLNNLSWPIYNGVVDFIVDKEDYAESFGKQWNLYSQIQIDSLSKRYNSEALFYKYTGWEINPKMSYLDLGCGAGRYADVLLKKDVGFLICVDQSTAAFVCQKNLKEIGYDETRFLVIRASIYNLPFNKHLFDRIFSIGVLQHVPDADIFVKHCFENVKKGGELAIWAYEKTVKAYFRYKYPLRYFTKSWRLSSKVKFSRILVKLFFPIFYPFYWTLRKFYKNPIPYIERIAPFAFRYDKDYKYSYELSGLDTIDNLTPRYDKPISEKKLTHLLFKYGAKSVSRKKAGGLALVAKY